MAAEELPGEFDVVILGTGLCESVVAAACARLGRRVLHLDRRSFYAGNWASFTFNGLLAWIEQLQVEAETQSAETADWSSLLEEGEEFICLSKSDSAPISNLQVFCYTSEEDEEEEQQCSGAPPPPQAGDHRGCEESVATATDASPAAEMKGEEMLERETAEEEEEEEKGEKEKKEEKEEEEKEEVKAQQVVAGEGEEPEATQPRPPESDHQSEPTRKRISYAQLLKEGRRFNIDLVSKLMFSRGSLVDLLIKSNVSRYAEFKNVTRILTYRDGRVEQVPCSRADVFASRQLSVVEKRKLMRFLTSCLEEPEEHRASARRPFVDLLRQQQLGANLQHFLLHSIAMATPQTSTEDALNATRHFLRCLGRYGNTPFLFPLYGLGEIPQCFCRMCAVFGGVYCLRHSVQCLITDKDTNRCKAVIDSRGQRISCSHVVVEDSYLPTQRQAAATPTRSVSRAVLITDASVLSSDSEQQVSLVTVPPVEESGTAVRLVELSSATMTCMPGTYLVHLTCQSGGSAHQDLSPLVTRMFRTSESADEDTRPHVLWCLYFNMADGSAVEAGGLELPPNVLVASGPDGALGHEGAITQAEEIFRKILPDEDFCPPAPNPEDIVYDGENSSAPTEEERKAEGGEEEQTEEREEEREKETEEQTEERGQREEEREKETEEQRVEE